MIDRGAGGAATAARVGAGGRQRAARRPRGNSWRVLRFALRDFLLSPWTVVLLVLLALGQLVLFPAKPDRQNFFNSQYVLTMIVAALAAGGLFGRAGRVEMHPILARAVSRTGVAGALLLGAWLVALGGYAISAAVTLVRYGPWFEREEPITGWLDLLVLAQGSAPVLLAALAAAAFIALLTSFVSPTGVRLFILALLALLIMSFDSRNFPLEFARPLLQQLPPVMAPFVGARRFASETPPDTLALYSLSALGAYAVALAILVLVLAAGRETAGE